MAVGGMMEGGEKGKGMILQFSDNQRSETETDSEAKVYPGTYSSTKDLIYSVGCVFMFIYSHTKGEYYFFAELAAVLLRELYCRIIPVAVVMLQLSGAKFSRPHIR